MRTKLIIIVFFILNNFCHGQDIIDWSPEYKIQLSDFKSPSTKIGEGTMYSLYSSSKISFGFYMNAIEFMLTKNFNSRVNTTFTKSNASLVSPDEKTAGQLVKFAQFDFDLAELYSRKFRQKLFENKTPFSNFNFYNPLYEEIEREFENRHSMVLNLTGFGRNEIKLKEEHDLVLKEINELANFCKTCNPKKK